MKQLCYASFLKILYYCKPKNVSQKHINGKLLMSIDPLYDLSDDDNAASTLASGNRNIPNDIAIKARSISYENITKYFNENIIVLLDPAKLQVAENALIDILLEDSSIPANTIIHNDKRITKAELIRSKCLLGSELLATLFLYAIINIKNSDCKESITEINKTYIAAFIEHHNKKMISNNVLPTPEVITALRPLQPSDFFRGREEKLKEIKKLLADNSKLMLLNGMGGIGKTEFCRKLFYDFLNEKHDELSKIGWIVFTNTIEQSFFRQFTELSYHNETPSEYLLRATNYINEHNGKLLLFIDNANDLSEQDAAMLSQLRCNIVLTSRKRNIERLQGIEIGKLSLEDCRILYRQHSEEYLIHSDYNYGITYEENDSYSEDLDAIITMADRHTLAMELLAKTQRSAAYTNKQMREILEKTNFSLSDISERVTYVHTPEIGNWAQQEQVFIEQFSKVFDISNIKNEKLRLLQLFSLLSVDTINSTDVRNWFDIEDLDVVNSLVLQGWIFRGYTNTTYDIAFSMHPLISSVVQYKAKPNFGVATPLAIGLSEILYYDDTDLFATRIPYINHAVSVVNKVSSSKEDYFVLVNAVSIILSHMGEYSQALTLLTKTVETDFENIELQEHMFSSLYHNIADCYMRLGEYEKAEENFHIAIDLLEDTDNPDGVALSTSYDSLGGLYVLLGEYDDALEYFNTALDIRKKALDVNHPKFALAYNNFGYVYDSMGKYDKALKYYKKALSIQEKWFNKEQSDLVTTHNNIGLTYKNLGEYKNALYHINKAYEIGDNILGLKHPDMLPVRDNIAQLHLEMGDVELSEKEQLELLEERIVLYGENHPDVSTNYHSLGTLYYQLANYDKSLNFLQNAYDISVELYNGENNVEVAKIIKSIADVYSLVEDMEIQALELYQKVLEIESKELGEDNVIVATAHNNVGVQYADMGQYAKARDEYEKALEINKSYLTENHPSITNIIYNIGRTYEDEGNLPLALKLYTQAYDSILNCFEQDVPELATISEGIASAYAKIEDYENSDKWFDRSIDLYSEFFGENHLQLVTTFYNYALSFESRKQYKEALTLYKKAKNIYVSYTDDNSDILQQIDQKIIFINTCLGKT